MKVGTGTWSLFGANTYSGGTTITDGNVSVSTDMALGAATGHVVVGPFSTLTYTGSSTTIRTFEPPLGVCCDRSGLMFSFLRPFPTFSSPIRLMVPAVWFSM